MARAVHVTLLAPLLGACGFGFVDEDPGGAANLPSAAAGPYGRLERDSETPADEPFLLADRFGVYRDPAALRRDDGGLRLWFGMDVEIDPGDSRIGYVELGSERSLIDARPVVALAPEAAWEGDRLAAPAVVALGDGRLVMFYEAGDAAAPAIGRADSTDDGATWQRRAAPVLEGAAGPTAAVVEDSFVLFVTVPGEAGIYRTDAFAIDATTATSLRPEPVVVPRPGVAEAFDAALVADPFIHVETTPAGRRVWNLWFAGAGEVTDAGPGTTAVGHAGSFDGERWERLPGPDPVLAGPAGGPTVLVDGNTGLMLFHEDERLRLGVAAATHP